MARQEDEEEVNFEILARKELAQLQRQYRVMETDRQTFIQGKGRNVSRQGRMLEYLRNEKSELLLDIENALSPFNQKKDKESENIIQTILEAYFSCVEEIQQQISEIFELETQVDKITKRVIHQKLKTQALYGQSMTVGKAAKRLRVLENRKYHVTTLFDDKVTQNALLRADINLSLMERGRFHDQYRALKRQIAAAKHKMLIIVDNALTTYEGREEAVMKIHMLRERNDKESQSHVMEIKEYQRVFHHDQKLRAFMKIKNKSRDVVEKSEDRKLRITYDKENQLDNLIRQYKRSFAQLLSLAKTKDVETLLHQYLNQEQSNFSSFKHITDLNNETCVLEEAIKKLKVEIENAVQSAKKGRKERAQELRDANRVREKNGAELSQLQEAWEAKEKHMSKVIHGIDVVFDKAGCQNAPVIQLLGNRSGILPRNLILCLKVLEHRIEELQYQLQLLEVRKAIIIDKTQLPVKQGYWQPGKKPPPAGGPFKPKVILTGQLSGDVDEGDEESEKQMSMRRMTYEEIKEYYKSKLLDQNHSSGGDPDSLDNDTSSLQNDSFSSITTKPKFGPIIKPTPEDKKPGGPRKSRHESAVSNVDRESIYSTRSNKSSIDEQSTVPMKVELEQLRAKAAKYASDEPSTQDEEEDEDEERATPLETIPEEEEEYDQNNKDSEAEAVFGDTEIEESELESLPPPTNTEQNE